MKNLFYSLFVLPLLFSCGDASGDASGDKKELLVFKSKNEFQDYVETHFQDKTLGDLKKIWGEYWSQCNWDGVIFDSIVNIPDLNGNQVIYSVGTTPPCYSDEQKITNLFLTKPQPRPDCYWMNGKLYDLDNVRNSSENTEIDEPELPIIEVQKIKVDNEAVTNCYDDLLKSQQEGFFWVEEMETTYSAFIDTYFMKIYYVCDGDYYEAINADAPDAYAKENGWMEYTGVLVPNPSMNGPNVYVVDGLPVGEIEFYQKTDFDRNQFQGY